MGKDEIMVCPAVTIYTDGACSGNPGPGGWAAVLICGEHRMEISGGFACTTNGRMELYAAMAALGSLKRECRVTLYTDAAYLANAINKGWLHDWSINGWHKSNRQPVHNMDLWRIIDVLLHKHTVRVVWVKGHADNQENNRCDQLAVAAAKAKNLPPDHFFEASIRNEQTED